MTANVLTRVQVSRWWPGRGESSAAGKFIPALINDVFPAVCAALRSQLRPRYLSPAATGETEGFTLLFDRRGLAARRARKVPGNNYKFRH